MLYCIQPEKTRGNALMDLILHHYPASPFSEKIRVAFGYKGLTWSSVTIPMMMPKPNLLPLTGGYRRTPVLQIGADIYCDTKLILDEVERRHPLPTFHPGGAAGRGSDHILSWWADHAVFACGVAVVFGAIARYVPEPFLEDRRQLSGSPLDIGQMEAAGPAMLGQLQAHLAAAQALLGANPYLRGSAPSEADFALYHVAWFVRNSYPGQEALFGPLPVLAAWMSRIAAFGHGTEVSLDEAAALDIARTATAGADLPFESGDLAGLAPGDAVTVTADDYGRDPVAGRLVGLTGERISLLREDSAIGSVVVHFPRTGYLLRRLPNS
jgi:glutathione S-transferase